MAATAAAVVGVIGLIGAISGKQGADAGAGQSEQLARENALLIEAEGREEERRATEENVSAQAEMRARSAASGTTGEGSQQIYMTSEQEKFDKDVAWLRKSTKSRADLERKQGKYAAASMKSQGKAGLWGGIGSAVKGAGTAYLLAG